MYFTTSFLASLLAASTFVSAAPLQRRKAQLQSLTSVQLDTSGAAYFLTNEGDENTILAAAVNVDGTLNLATAVTTGGSGSHGLQNLQDPDPLFSQGSIKASQKGQVLAAVNSGSNTLSLFSIDSKNPTNIQQIGNPVSSEGEFPQSVAFNSNGNRLCVLNGGAVNNVACFNVDKKNGLTAIANSQRSLNLNQSTPATGLGGSASQLIFSEDDKQVIASVKGDSKNNGFIAIFDVQNDGSLANQHKTITPPGNSQPFGMTIIPGKNALLVADASIGFDIIDLNGNKSAAVKINGQNETGWTSFSQKTGNFYLTDIGTSIISEVNVDNNLNAKVVKQYKQTANSATMDSDVISVGGNDFLYVLAPNKAEVQVLSIQKAAQGQNLSPLDINGPAKAGGITISAKNLQGMTTFSA